MEFKKRLYVRTSSTGGYKKLLNQLGLAHPTVHTQATETPACFKGRPSSRPDDDLNRCTRRKCTHAGSAELLGHA